MESRAETEFKHPEKLDYFRSRHMTYSGTYNPQLSFQSSLPHARIKSRFRRPRLTGTDAVLGKVVKVGEHFYPQVDFAPLRLPSFSISVATRGRDKFGDVRQLIHTYV